MLQIVLISAATLVGLAWSMWVNRAVDSRRADQRSAELYRWQRRR